MRNVHRELKKKNYPGLQVGFPRTKHPFIEMGAASQEQAACREPLERSIEVWGSVQTSFLSIIPCERTTPVSHIKINVNQQKSDHIDHHPDGLSKAVRFTLSLIHI